jgi:hypothetical protein
VKGRKERRKVKGKKAGREDFFRQVLLNIILFWKILDLGSRDLVEMLHSISLIGG